MEGLADLERRIAVALERIRQSIATLTPPEPAKAETPAVDLAALQAELDSERKQRLLAQVRLDQQDVDITRLRQTVKALRENIDKLTRTQTQMLPDVAALDAALRAEVQAMRAERLSEMAELETLMAELDPRLDPQSAHPAAQEVPHDA